MKEVMDQMQFTSFFSWINSVFSYKPFVISLFAIAIICKLLLLFFINRYRKKAANQITIILFSIPLLTYVIAELAWIIFLTGSGLFMKVFCRVAWHMQPLQFFALSLFLYSVIDRNYKLSSRSNIILRGLCVFVFIPVFSAVYTLCCFGFFENSLILQSIFFVLEELLFKVGATKRFLIHSFGLLFLVYNILYVVRKVRTSKEIPYILRLQVTSFFLLLSTFVLPEVILMLADIIPALALLHDSLPVALLASALFTTALLFYARKIYRLRFLNLTPFVHAEPIKNAGLQLRSAKQALCEATAISDLAAIHASFFHDIAGIEPDRIHFVLRIPELQEQIASQETNTLLQQVEVFLQQEEEIMQEFFHEDSVLVYDELAFTSFYQQSESISKLLNFLRSIQAAVLIPLKQGERMLGFLMIQKHPVQEELFPLSLQTQMGLYGTYVTYTITRFEQYQYQSLLSENERLSVDLHKTIQKVIRYQESFSAMMQIDDIKKQGIILYKNASFTFVNTVAEELVQINPNLHHGHPLSKALKEVVRRVGMYGNFHAIIEKNTLGEDICCKGFPYKKDEVFILISPDDIMKTLKIENTLIKPSDVDYFVFLYTTEAGTLLHEALPGKSELLQKFKIQFLKTVLSRKSMIFDVHHEDFEIFVALAQRISSRTIIHTIDLKETPLQDVICASLFGIQQFSQDGTIVERGLLDRLDENGILCIKNINRIDLKTQQLLAQFMKTGVFHVYKSEIRKSSNPFMIFSSDENIAELVKKGQFSKELFEQIQDGIVSFPSLSQFPFSDIESLAEGIQKQIIPIAEYHHLFGFSSSERENLDMKRPVSVHELRQRVKWFMKQRIKQSAIIEERTVYSSQKTVTDPLLIDAARLGKQALKDRKMLRALWDKLKNQSKIAQLLSVDRSSVHRRCREFGILSPPDASSPDVSSPDVH
jgi:transcriptional regulator with GAF, ATPase, and Fis domain